MKREQVLRVGILLWLMVVWILLWGNISFGNIFGGLAVGLIIMVLLPLPAYRSRVGYICCRFCVCCG